MLISLIHPSRGRPEKAYQTADKWLRYAGTPVNYCCSVDESDPLVYEYKKLFELESKANWFWLTMNDNKSVVDATNNGIKNVPGDIFIYLSDDFACPPNWAASVLKEFEGVTRPMLIKVDDCLQGFHVPVLTIPIMNRALYEKLGYFWHPEYKSMFVDCDLYETVKRIGALKLCPHLKFPHEHHSIGKAENDETYRASERNWEQGRILFNKRKAAGFPV